MLCCTAGQRAHGFGAEGIHPVLHSAPAGLSAAARLPQLSGCPTAACQQHGVDRIQQRSCPAAAAAAGVADRSIPQQVSPSHMPLCCASCIQLACVEHACVANTSAKSFSCQMRSDIVCSLLLYKLMARSLTIVCACHSRRAVSTADDSASASPRGGAPDANGYFRPDRGARISANGGAGQEASLRGDIAVTAAGRTFSDARQAAGTCPADRRVGQRSPSRDGSTLEP